MLLLALLAAVGAVDPPSAPPFSFSLDQSVPCPEGGFDYSLASAEGMTGLSPAEVAGSAPLQEILQSVPAFLDGKLKQLNCPSASIIVVQGGRTIYSSFRGSTRVNGSAAAFPPTADSGYQIASISKTFTAAMLFKLRDEGRLPQVCAWPSVASLSLSLSCVFRVMIQGLDTPVSALLPEFSLRPPPRVNGRPSLSRRPITLRALAMHASGMPREVPNCDGNTAAAEAAAAGFRSGSGSCKDQAAILAAVANLTALCAPFYGTHYSNLGIALLGRALEKAANATWEEYVTRELMQPLGMLHSGPPPATNAAMAEGVDPATGKKVCRNVI